MCQDLGLWPFRPLYMPISRVLSSWIMSCSGYSRVASETRRTSTWPWTQDCCVYHRSIHIRLRTKAVQLGIWYRVPQRCRTPETAKTDAWKTNHKTIKDFLLFRDKPKLWSDMFNTDDITFYYGSTHQLISWIFLSFGFISVSFLCLYLCSFYLYLVYDLIIK